ALDIVPRRILCSSGRRCNCSGDICTARLPQTDRFSSRLSMATFLLRRLLASIIVIFGVVTLVFFVLRAVPGDPIASILGEQALAVDKQAMRECLNLDKPLWEQYALFWGDVA